MNLLLIVYLIMHDEWQAFEIIRATWFPTLNSGNEFDLKWVWRERKSMHSFESYRWRTVWFDECEVVKEMTEEDEQFHLSNILTKTYTTTCK